MVVAIRMTEDGPELTTVGKYELHPAAELFPEGDRVATRFLENDLKTNGQQAPLLLDAHGLLVDGRARVRILEKLGVRPVVRTLDPSENPWLAAIKANQHKLEGLGVSQRAALAGRVPCGPGGRRVADDDPRATPRTDDVGELLGVNRSSVQRFRTLLEPGVPIEFQQAVRDGRITVSLAGRAARGFPPDKALEYIRRVLNGAPADRLAKAMGLPSSRTQDGPPEPTRSLVEQVKRDSSDPRRHKHVGLPAIDALITALSSLHMVTDGVEELDPKISAVQAAELERTIVRHRGSLHVVLTLLRERKGSIK